jgi:hypothetical protein
MQINEIVIKAYEEINLNEKKHSINEMLFSPKKTNYY